MVIDHQVFQENGLIYTVRSALKNDAKELSELRVEIDGETENLDRERGEAFLDEHGFAQVIHRDTKSPRNLFLVAITNGRIVGYSRCEGTDLKRFSHKVEFGICVLSDYWGYRIGKNLLETSCSNYKYIKTKEYPNDLYRRVSHCLFFSNFSRQKRVYFLIRKSHLIIIF